MNSIITKNFKILALGFCALLVASVASARSLQITDSFENPIAGAKVFILSASNKPIAPTPLITDGKGIVQLPKETKDLLSVNVKAEKFIASSFLNVSSDIGVLQLNAQDPEQLIEIQGESLNFGKLPKDGQVDFSLVYPALSRRGLINFDVTSLVSPEFDTIKVSVQKVDLPSNLTLPEQKETYILPITLKKPNYRMFVKNPGDYRMIATHGQFPLKKVISDVQGGKSIFDVINYFDFKQSGHRDISATGPIQGQDIDVAGLAFDATTSVTAPELTGRQRMVSAAAYSQDTYFFPTDIKNVESKAVQELKIPSARVADSFIVSALTVEAEKKPAVNEGPLSAVDYLAQGFDKLFHFLVFGEEQDPERAGEGLEVSVALQAVGSTKAVNFLGLVAAPQITDGKILLQQPMANNEIQAVATYLVLAEITETQHGEYKIEKRTRLWELLQPGWVSEVTLPENDFVKEKNKNYRWEVMYLGTTDKIAPASSYFLDSVTHVSRNSRSL